MSTKTYRIDYSSPPKSNPRISKIFLSNIKTPYNCDNKMSDFELFICYSLKIESEFALYCSEALSPGRLSGFNMDYTIQDDGKFSRGGLSSRVLNTSRYFSGYDLSQNSAALFKVLSLIMRHDLEAGSQQNVDTKRPQSALLNLF